MNTMLFLSINEADFGASSTACLTINSKGRVVYVKDTTEESTNYCYDSWNNRLNELLGLRVDQVKDWAYWFFRSSDEDESYGYRIPWVQVG